MTNHWRKNEEMAVWGYDKKTKGFRQIKEAVKAPLAGFKLMTRTNNWVILVFYPGTNTQPTSLKPDTGSL